VNCCHFVSVKKHLIKHLLLPVESLAKKAARCLATVKRFAEEILSEMTYSVLSGILNSTLYDLVPESSCAGTPVL